MLHIAAHKGHIPIIQYLINQNADVNSQNAKGWTPLMFAVEGNQLDAIQFLLESGGNVWIVNN